MIHNVYEKAIFEPSFGDIYADLCSRLSDKTKQNPFVRIIESDEEPPTENGGAQGGEETSSHNTVYRWSNDVSTDDSEIIGPFESVEDVVEAALDADNCPEPTKREKEMVLHSVKIHRGQFIKIMHPVDNPEELYTVFFPVSKAKEIGQQMSDIFLSEIECNKDGSKRNSFKVILLNKCQDEFTKKNIYVAWRIEKKAHDAQKGSLKEPERISKEEDLEFRRMKIKKQMLGNIRFIGELFKIGMLKVKVMRDCVESLLKLQQERNGENKLT
jgi:translation initiation factor 4G